MLAGELIKTIGEYALSDRKEDDIKPVRECIAAIVQHCTTTDEPQSKNTINGADAKGFTAFILAANYGLIELIPDLLQAGANPYLAIAPAYLTIFNAAVQKGHLQFLQALSERVPKINLPQVQQVDEYENISATKFTLLEFEDLTGYRPLARAALHGDVAMVKFLVEQKADVNAMTRNGWSPLFCAQTGPGPNQRVISDAEKTARQEITTFLANAGGISQSTEIKCETVAPEKQKQLNQYLQRNVIKGLKENSLAFIRQGADLNYRESEITESTFEIAATKKQKDDPQFLQLLYNASRTTIKTTTLSKAFFAAVSQNHCAHVIYMLDAKLVKIETCLPATRVTALHLAAQSGFSDMVELLCAQADIKLIINAQDEKGHTALYLAIERGHEKTALVLLNAGAEIDHATLNRAQSNPSLHELLTNTKTARAQQTEEKEKTPPATVNGSKTEITREMSFIQTKVSFLELWDLIKTRNGVFEDGSMKNRFRDPLYSAFLLALKFFSEQKWVSGIQHLRICLRLVLAFKPESEEKSECDRLKDLFPILLATQDATKVEVESLQPKIQQLFAEFSRYMTDNQAEFADFLRIQENYRAQISRVVAPAKSTEAVVATHSSETTPMAASTSRSAQILTKSS